MSRCHHQRALLVVANNSQNIVGRNVKGRVMTRHVESSSWQAAMPDALLIDAARRWRCARDAGQAVQPALFDTLAPRDCGVLAPVFDSLLRLSEGALGRRFSTGADGWISEDELLLLSLVQGARPPSPPFGRPSRLAGLLDCAVRSARIMLALTVPRPNGVVLG